MAPRPIVMPGRMVAPPPDRSTGFNGRDRKGGRVLFAAREGIIGKGDVGSYEDVVLNTQTIPELNAGFDRNTVPDEHIVLDENVGTDVAVGSDAGAGEDYDKLPDAGVGADVCGLNFSQWMYLRRHTSPNFKDQIAAVCCQGAC